MGSGRVGYRKWEVLTPPDPPHYVASTCHCVSEGVQTALATWKSFDFFNPLIPTACHKEDFQ